VNVLRKSLAYVTRARNAGSLLLHLRLLHELEMPTMRRKTNMNPYHEHAIVRIRRKVTRSHYLNKAVYRYHRYELTIPARYKDLIEAFMNKDLTVEAKQEANTLIIVAKPAERYGSQ
jgi:hypothetical protein